eukprot:GDKJ01001474.1.p1 GENE.GDKJ01001474.1~~GDKJ01001474.1.p1  ORF type:complete len:1328 (-),score=442.70 GDKJ01001474.1:65-3646(-)
MVKVLQPLQILNATESEDLIQNLNTINPDWLPKSGVIVKAPTATEHGIMIHNPVYTIYEDLLKKLNISPNNSNAKSAVIAEGWIESISDFVVDLSGSSQPKSAQSKKKHFRSSSVLFLPSSSSAGARRSVVVGSVDFDIDFTIQPNDPSVKLNQEQQQCVHGKLTVKPLSVHLDRLPINVDATQNAEDILDVASPQALLSLLIRLHGAVKIEVICKDASAVAARGTGSRANVGARVAKGTLMSLMEDVPLEAAKPEDKKSKDDSAADAKKKTNALLLTGSGGSASHAEAENQKQMLLKVSGNGVILRESCFSCSVCPSKTRVDSVGCACLSCPQAAQQHVLDSCGLICRLNDFRRQPLNTRLALFTSLPATAAKSYSLHADVRVSVLQRSVSVPMQLLDPLHSSSMISLRACRSVTHRIMTHSMNFMSNRQIAMLSDMTFSPAGIPASIVSAVLVKRSQHQKDEELKDALKLKEELHRLNKKDAEADASKSKPSSPAKQLPSTASPSKGVESLDALMSPTSPPPTKKDMLDVTFHLVKAWDSCIARTGGIDFVSKTHVLSHLLNMEDSLAKECAKFDYLKIVFVPSGGAPSLPSAANSSNDNHSDAAKNDITVSLGIPLTPEGTLADASAWDIREDFKSSILSSDGSQRLRVIIPFEGHRQSQQPFISYAQFVDAVCRSPVLSEALAKMTCSSSSRSSPIEVNAMVHLPKLLTINQGDNITSSAVLEAMSNMGNFTSIPRNGKNDKTNVGYPSWQVAKAAAESLSKIPVCAASSLSSVSVVSANQLKKSRKRNAVSQSAAIPIARFKEADRMLYDYLPTVLFASNNVKNAAASLPTVADVLKAKHLNKQEKLAVLAIRRSAGLDDYTSLFSIKDANPYSIDSDNEQDASTLFVGRGLTRRKKASEVNLEERKRIMGVLGVVNDEVQSKAILSDRITPDSHSITLHAHDTLLDFLLKTERASFTLSNFSDSCNLSAPSLQAASNANAGGRANSSLLGKSAWHGMRLFVSTPLIAGNIYDQKDDAAGDKSSSPVPQRAVNGDGDADDNFCMLFMYMPTDPEVVSARLQVEDALLKGSANSANITLADVLDANAMQNENNWLPLNPKLSIGHLKHLFSVLSVPPRFKVERLTYELISASSRVRQYLASSPAGRDLMARLEAKARSRQKIAAGQGTNASGDLSINRSDSTLDRTFKF